MNLNEVKRKAIAFYTSPKWWVIWVCSILVIAWYALTDPDGGRETLQRIQWLAWLIVIVGPVYIMRRALADARSKDAAAVALKTPTGAGLVFIGLCILAGLLFIAFAPQARGAILPDRAIVYLPILDREITYIWPEHPMRSVTGSLVEQETCISLTHWMCWNPRAELKTSREYGFGLGQHTIAYYEDGSERFNRWRELSDKHVELRGWTWDNRYDAGMQLRAMVLDNRGCFRRLRQLIPDDFNIIAMCDAAYNGGMGGLLNDRRLCAQKEGCNPDKWFGHVEMTSSKSRVKWRGYGKSAYEINREHVTNVIYTRRPKYAEWWRKNVLPEGA